MKELQDNKVAKGKLLRGATAGTELREDKLSKAKGELLCEGTARNKLQEDDWPRASYCARPKPGTSCRRTCWASARLSFFLTI